jgi:hypothetical protein
MGVVGHDGQLPPRGDHPLEQPAQLVGVGVGDEPVRPVADRLGPDPDGPDRLQPGRQQRLQEAGQDLGPHDHRVTPGEQHVADLRVPAQIAAEHLRVVAGHPQIGLAHELGPAEAVGAEGVAHLPRAGEEQDRLGVLVLQAVQRAVAAVGDVQRQLAARVRVQAPADVTGLGRDPLGGRVVTQQLGHGDQVGRVQHLRGREGEPVDGVVLDVVPVDQLVGDVAVGPERQDRGHGPHLQQVVVGAAGQLRDLPQVPGGVGAEHRPVGSCARHRRGGSGRHRARLLRTGTRHLRVVGDRAFSTGATARKDRRRARPAQRAQPAREPHKTLARHLPSADDTPNSDGTRRGA